MLESEPYTSPTLIIIIIIHFYPFESLTLDHGGEAIRRVSGAYQAPDAGMVDWIKLASNIIKKGDVDGYAHLTWPQYLSLAWLGLQISQDFFIHFG